MNPQTFSYIKQGKDIIKELLVFYNSPQWKVYKESENLIVYSYIGTHGLICIKGVTLFPFNIHVIKDFVDDVEKFNTIESMVDHSKVVESHGFNTYVCYTKIKKFLIAAP
mgnify:FL=1